jgi:hypothetical protein
MTEEEWLSNQRLYYREPRLKEALARGCSARKFGLFALACCERAQAALNDYRCCAYLQAAERFFEEGDWRELEQAHEGAREECDSAGHPELIDGGWDATPEGWLTDAVFHLTLPGLTDDQRPRWAATVARSTVRAIMDGRRATGGPSGQSVWDAADVVALALLRDIFGNPFRPIVFAPEWRTDTVVLLARRMWPRYDAMPILADALQDAGCDNDDILDHCRGPGPHVLGCWVVDSVLDKE